MERRGAYSMGHVENVPHGKLRPPFVVAFFSFPSLIVKIAFAMMVLIHLEIRHAHSLARYSRDSSASVQHGPSGKPAG
jgi:hypothetical protein